MCRPIRLLAFVADNIKLWQWLLLVVILKPMGWWTEKSERIDVMCMWLKQDFSATNLVRMFWKIVGIVFHIANLNVTRYYLSYRYRGRTQLPLKRLPDSSIFSLIQAGWRQEGHPVTKNLFPYSHGYITALWGLNAIAWLSCLPYAVGKQLSIPLINLRRK